MRLRVGSGDRFQASIDDIADLQEEFAQAERQVDQQLLLDLHQQIVVRQLQRHRNRLVEFAQLFDDLFHLHLLS